MGLRIILFTLLLYSTSPTHAQKEYELTTEKDGVQIFLKEAPKKGFIEYKGVLTIKNVAFAKVINTLVDYENHSTWIYNCIDSQLLESQPYFTYLHQTCNAIWPLKKRDYILLVKTEKINDRTFIVTLTSVPEYIPLVENHVRIDEFEGKWVLQDEKKHISISLFGSFDPKISLSSFFLRNYSKKIPFKTLTNLKEILLATN